MVFYPYIKLLQIKLHLKHIHILVQVDTHVIDPKIKIKPHIGCRLIPDILYNFMSNILLALIQTEFQYGI